MVMSKEEHAEMMYQLSISIAVKMLKNHIINKEEFEKMNCILLEKYHPFIGGLFSLNDLIY
nr:MAG TPA: hypothetical protein [Caudoviricetes sp.]